jgi:acyl carrier protein
MDAVDELIFKILREKFSMEPKPDMSLAALGVDSLGMAELTVDLEKQFGIKVDEDILGTETVGELIAYVRSKQQKS